MIGIEHVGIFSKDSEALKNWYIELFGWKEVYTNAEKKTYFLKADDGAMIEFCLTKEEGASSSTSALEKKPEYDLKIQYCQRYQPLRADTALSSLFFTSPLHNRQHDQKTAKAAAQKVAVNIRGEQRTAHRTDCAKEQQGKSGFPF